MGTRMSSTRELLIALATLGSAPEGLPAVQAPAPRAQDAGVAALVMPLPTEGESPFYVGHTAPLRADPLLKLPTTSVRAHGWLDEQLRLMAEGMFGHLPELSQWCRPDGSAWRSADGQGERGWE